MLNIHQTALSVIIQGLADLPNLETVHLSEKLMSHHVLLLVDVINKLQFIHTVNHRQIPKTSTKEILSQKRKKGIKIDVDFFRD